LYFLMHLGTDVNSQFYHSHNSSTTNDCFGVIYFDNGNMTPGQYKPIKGADFCTKSIDFNNGGSNKPTLSSLHISFLKHNGQTVTREDTNQMTYHNLLLEIEHN